MAGGRLSVGVGAFRYQAVRRNSDPVRFDLAVSSRRHLWPDSWRQHSRIDERIPNRFGIKMAIIPF